MTEPERDLHELIRKARSLAEIIGAGGLWYAGPGSRYGMAIDGADLAETIRALIAALSYSSGGSNRVEIAMVPRKRAMSYAAVGDAEHVTIPHTAVDDADYSSVSPEFRRAVLAARKSL